MLWEISQADGDFAHARGEFAVVSAKAIILENVVM
jgi:hypothetical protein